MNKIEEFLKDVRKANVINGVMFEKLNEIAGRYQASDYDQLTLTDVGCSLPTSTQLIEDCKKRFEELKENYSFDWRSFYNGYLESFGKYKVK